MGGQITLHAFDAGKMAAGMPIRYLGIDIGQIQSLELITAKTRCRRKPSLSGIRRHVCPRRDPLLGDHPADLRRGRGASRHLCSSPILTLSLDAARRAATLRSRDTTISDSRYIDGLNIVVEAPEAGSLGIGTPVLFRGLEVGTVTGLSLGSMSDRVMVKMRISKRYQYRCAITRCSGWPRVTASTSAFGWRRGENRPSISLSAAGSLLATPPGTPLAPKARDGKHFLLLESEPKEWREGHRPAAVILASPSPAPANAGRGQTQTSRPGVLHRGVCRKLRTLFFFLWCAACIRKYCLFPLKRFSLKCARRCRRTSFRRIYRRLSAPATPKYSRQYAENQRR